ncbi:hypothetical protein PVL29_021053 [Vitis rotundifolia]|uniref:Disease resistance protein At4g27190-like leucine-rich repeats domain-containing protein n=1 Tax=Vitis rotundifolia TaxID=103349 RepID=A0AA38YZ06_VITRO|nr:hypothetical protein PVL29_021053 [Vitis rotundifolia]
MFHHNNNALEDLNILGYPNLRIIPDCLYNLKDLQIGKCENLELQPHQLQGLTYLTSLKITNCENIKMPLSEWGLARSTSLKTLTISDYHHHHSLLLPTTLAELFISSFKNLESLAFLSLQRLTSLKRLCISSCPNLQSFLPREGLFNTLSELFITYCPLLIQRCSKEKREDWPKIAHIPYVKIDDRLIL